MTKVLKKWIAPKDFYKKVFLISVPLALQQLLNSAMGIADSMMVSWIGQVTAVGTAAQIENLMMTVGFGVASGAGIFMSQFFGKRDLKSEKKAFGLGVILSLINALVWVAASVFFGRQLMRFYIPDPTVIESALQYLMIAMISYLPGALITMFSFAYRWSGQHGDEYCFELLPDFRPLWISTNGRAGRSAGDTDRADDGSGDSYRLRL